MVTAALLPAMACVPLAACEGHASKSLAWVIADGEGYEARMAAIADEGDHGRIDPRTVAWGHGGEHSRIVRVGDDSCVVMGSVAGADEADAAYAAIAIREG